MHLCRRRLSHHLTQRLSREIQHGIFDRELDRGAVFRILKAELGPILSFDKSTIQSLTSEPRSAAVNRLSIVEARSEAFLMSRLSKRPFRRWQKGEFGEFEHMSVALRLSDQNRLAGAGNRIRTFGPAD